MQPLNFPQYPFRISRSDTGSLFIYDEYRKKALCLTPEEWVRQHILRFLTEDRGIPKSLISSEAGVKVNTLSRRYDALVYNRRGLPVLLIECKAPSVVISQNTFDQVIAYNLSIKAHHVLVTNGLKHFCCHIHPDTRQVRFLPDIPHFDVLDN